MMLLSRTFRGVEARYREGDEHVLVEVLERRPYRRAKAGFDVEPGERWLDLGANIGAFALYCRSRGARAVCYEPEPGCFEVLQANVPEFELVQAAVTASKRSSISFFVSRKSEDYSRGTIYPVRGYPSAGELPNIWAGTLKEQIFDGIKLDIEGAEGPILDEWLLPSCRKLVMEYHTSRDDSVVNLKRRLELLKDHFNSVHYVKFYDQKIAEGADRIRLFFDRMVFAWDPK